MNVEHELAAAIKAQADLAMRIKELEAAKRVLDESAPEHKLAILLHDKTCKWNHTDGCDWHYNIHKGVHDWNSHGHHMYLTRARTVMRQCEGIGLDLAKVEEVAGIILGG
jgi:hypothetical protein